MPKGKFIRLGSTEARSKKTGKLIKKAYGWYPEDGTVDLSSGGGYTHRAKNKASSEADAETQAQIYISEKFI